MVGYTYAQGWISFLGLQELTYSELVKILYNSMRIKEKDGQKTLICIAKGVKITLS